MDGQLLSLLLDIKSKQEAISDDVGLIKTQLTDLPCKVNGYKIGLLQKVVYGAVGIILVAFLATLLPEKTNISKTKANACQGQVIENEKRKNK